MSGGYYVALSGMRNRLNDLDRLADEIANAGTAGFKGERASRTNVRRPDFDLALETAIDTATGERRLDVRQGSITPTGRDLDVAIDGEGFIAVQTPAGTRYTRNGHFDRTVDGTLTTADGAVVLGADGPLKVGTGPVTVEEDGTVRAGDTVAGRLSVVRFAAPDKLVREGGALLRADGETPLAAGEAVIRAGALEKSNVSVVERVAELTGVSRSFEALQKAVSVLMNDVDGRVIDSLGRR